MWMFVGWIGAIAVLALALAIVSLCLVASTMATARAARLELDRLRRAAPGPSEMDAPAPEKPGAQAGPDQPGDRMPADQGQPAAAAEPRTPIKESVARRMSRLEQSLSNRWLIWLGGLALAIGGAFLVAHAFDRGWFTPEIRIAMGLVFAAATIGVGEFLYRWLPRRAQARGEQPSTGLRYIPAGLTAGGVCTAFGTVFAAHELYAMVDPLLAFGIMAAVALAAVGLSLRHGFFMALLGIAGAYLVPLLIVTEQPSAIGLFPYLFAVAASGVAVMRRREWWWLAAANLAGAMILAMAWFYGQWHQGDVWIVGPYLLAIAALFVFGGGRAAEPVEPANLAWWRCRPRHPANLATAVALAASGIALFMLVRSDNFSVPSLAMVGAWCLLVLLAACREPSLDLLPFGAAALVTALIASWPILRIVPRTIDGVLVGPVTLADPTTIGLVAGGFGLLFGVGGFLQLWRARRPALWATLSAGGPGTILFVAYAVATNFERDIVWGAIALALALPYLGAAWLVSARRDQPNMKGALAAYAVGVTDAVTLAAAVALFQSWLTVALALQVVAIAWIYRYLPFRALQATAAALTVAVLVRLVLNPGIADYAIGSTPLWNWLLYGYGVPILALLAASRLFGTNADRRLIWLFQAGALTLGVVFAGLELRTLFSGDGRFDSAGLPFAELALHPVLWLTGALGLLWLRRGRAGNPVLVWGARVLAIAGIAYVALISVLAGNPLYGVGVWDGPAPRVGSWPILNLLGVAYLLPAILLGAIHAMARRNGERVLSGSSTVAALVLGFVWTCLSVTQAFQGTDLTSGPTSDAEWWAYSAAWIAYGGVLLALGLWRGSSGLRYASLAVVMIAVAKVFLVDLSALEGFFRALSFIALGLSLLGIGYLYQRFAFPPQRGQGAAAIAG